MRRVGSALMNTSLARAMRCWIAVAQSELRGIDLVAQSVSKWRRGQLSCGWNAWASACSAMATWRSRAAASLAGLLHGEVRSPQLLVACSQSALATHPVRHALLPDASYYRLAHHASCQLPPLPHSSGTQSAQLVAAVSRPAPRDAAPPTRRRRCTQRQGHAAGVASLARRVAGASTSS